MAIRPVHEPTSGAFWLLLAAKEDREARAFMMVWRGMQSVDNAFLLRRDSRRRNGRSVERGGNDQTAPSSLIGSVFWAGSAAQPGVLGFESGRWMSLSVCEGSI